MTDPETAIVSGEDEAVNVVVALIVSDTTLITPLFLLPRRSAGVRAVCVIEGEFRAGVMVAIVGKCGARLCSFVYILAEGTKK